MADLTEYMSTSYFRADEVKAAQEAGKPMIGVIVSEPVIVETQFKDKDGSPVKRVEFDVEMADGSTKSASLNKTSVTNIGKVYSADSQKWIGKKVRFSVAMTKTPTGMKDVIYVYPVEMPASTAASSSPIIQKVVPVAPTVKMMNVRIVKEIPDMPEAYVGGKLVRFKLDSVLELPLKEAQGMIDLGYAVKVFDLTGLVK